MVVVHSIEVKVQMKKHFFARINYFLKNIISTSREMSFILEKQQNVGSMDFVSLPLSLYLSLSLAPGNQPAYLWSRKK